MKLEARLAALGSFLAFAACGGGGAPVAGLQITEVSLYQGVRTSVMRDGAAVSEPDVAVVRGRYAFFRVFVRPGDGWQARKVSGTLDVYDGDKKVATVGGSTANVSGASSEDDLGTTINFEVPGDKVGQNLGWAVRLLEAGGPGKPSGSTEGGFFPASGKAAITTRDLGRRLKVVLVPMRYKADGSSRVPDTSPLMQQRFRNLMYATYPVPSVDLKVREPIDLNVAVGAGSGWSEALDLLLRTRNSDGVGSDVYYYGVFKPTDSFGSYCAGGCITGLSSGSPSASDASVRGSIGVAFENDSSYQPESTFIHEVGHAHGRMHSPCGLGGQPSDRNYPHSGAVIGVTGYDFTAKTLVPTSRKDFMSYCDPIWTSDYTYRGILDRVYTVNASIPEGQLLRATARWRMLRLTSRGLYLGSALDLDAPPSGEKVRVQRADGKGAAMPSLTAWLQPYSHLEGGILLVPESELRGVAELSHGSHTLRLTEQPGAR